MSNILDRINRPNDVKNISKENLSDLAREIRYFLVKNVSETGGHLASNLGVVELTIALHRFMDFPEDKLVWDVGHQAYVHKILTGRKDLFPTLRQYNGMSGFPKRNESECDAFDTGHSSTSVSVANGIAKARDLKGENYKVVAVIGDGALSGGMAYEALNNISRMKANLMIVLNDNEMSIAENVGGMANYLAKVRTSYRYTGFKMGLEKLLTKIPVAGKAIVDKLKKSKDSVKRLLIPGMLFEDMGLTYIGPIDGHNFEQLGRAFASASRVAGPVIVHVVTKKGKGYKKAETNPSAYHGVEPFDMSKGVVKSRKKTYSSVFAEEIEKAAENDKRICAITAAMPAGTGLEEFASKYKKRCFDVGIAEEHAVTFAAGLASGGMHPVVAIYSTFLQRAYDQIVHDVCIGKFPVTFMVDRAGIVGRDGETHQGIFDLSYLTHIPNLLVMAPKNEAEMREMFRFSVGYDAPSAIRYPRGEVYKGLSEYNEAIVPGKSELICSGGDVALFALGSMVKTAVVVKEMLEESGITVTIINARFAAPLDYDMIRKCCSSHKLFVTMEENVARGGIGEAVAAFMCSEGITTQLLSIAIPDKFLGHGSPEELEKLTGIDADSICSRILDRM